MTSSPNCPRRGARVLVACALVVLAVACTADTTAPGTQGNTDTPGSSFHSALVRVTLSGIGSGQMHASAAMAAPRSVALSTRPAAPAHDARFTPSADLTGPVNSSGSGDGTIELEPLSTGSFTQGERGSDGVRYFWATFRVRNAQSDSTPYDTPRENLTFFATATDSTLGGSAIASLRRFDGSAADPSIATEVLPTGAVSQVDDAVLSNHADVLQVLTADEAAAVSAPEGVTVLPYGFVVHNASDKGRTLPASPAVGQYDGIVTFAFKVPLQATSADDPFTIIAMFLAEDDDETRITQSLEEQTPEGAAAFLERAEAIGATMKTVLPGAGSYAGGTSSSTRTLCTVPTTATSTGGTAYLVHRPVASIQLSDPVAGFPLSSGGSVARSLGITVRDSGGSVMSDVPAQLTGTTGVVTPWGSSGVRMVPRRDRASASVTATACGLTSASITLNTSGYAPLAAGYSHSLALRSDGTVAAWGDNTLGQTAVPAGLTDVVQVAAGYYHSLALGADGTVVAWGDDGSGQTDAPNTLTDVVQIAGGFSHSLALEADGTVAAWGDNSFGQTNIPAEATDVVQVSAAGNHSLALKADGTVVGWGDNDYGETVPPPGLTGVVQVATGISHSLALKADGTVVGWGKDTYGEATAPPGLTDVVQVAAGNLYSLALKADGTVVTWGDGSFGQTNNFPPDLAGVVQIARGVIHSLALKADGTVVAWGYNGYGQTNVPGGLVAAVP